MNMKGVIIHYVSKRAWPAYPPGPLTWVISYEIRGEWKPTTRPLVDLLENGHEGPD